MSITWALVFAAIRWSWKSEVSAIRLAGLFIIEQQGPGTSRNVCGVLSVFVNGHLLNFGACFATKLLRRGFLRLLAVFSGIFRIHRVSL